MASTNPNGEIVVLDSAGYGTVNITQSVAIIAPLGVHAGISATSGVAVTVNAGATDVVTLTNLYINSQGAATGISDIGGGKLHIDHCTVSGFAGNGIELLPTAITSVNVSDTTSRNCGQSGIYADSAPTLRVSVDHCRFEQNQYGIVGDRASVYISDSVADTNSQYGFWARGGAQGGASMAIDRSAASHNFYGVAVNGSCALTAHDVTASDNAYGFYANGTLSLHGCVASGSSYGVTASGGSATVTDSTISSNTNGVYALNGAAILTRTTITKNDTAIVNSGGTVYSAGDNVIFSNTSAGAGVTAFSKM